MSWSKRGSMAVHDADFGDAHTTLREKYGSEQSKRAVLPYLTHEIHSPAARDGRQARPEPYASGSGKAKEASPWRSTDTAFAADFDGSAQGARESSGETSTGRASSDTTCRTPEHNKFHVAAADMTHRASSPGASPDALPALAARSAGSPGSPTLQTAKALAAEARKLASSLAASMPIGSASRVGGHSNGNSTTPVPPSTPQQNGLQEEAEQSSLHGTASRAVGSEDVVYAKAGSAGSQDSSRQDAAKDALEDDEHQQAHEEMLSPVKFKTSLYEQRAALEAEWKAREQAAAAAAAAQHGSPRPASWHGTKHEESAQAHHDHLDHDAALLAMSQRPPMPPYDPKMPSYMRPTVNSVTRNALLPETNHATRARSLSEHGLGALLQPRQPGSPSASKSPVDERYEPVKRPVTPETPGLEEVLDTVHMPHPPATEEELRPYTPVPKKPPPEVPGLDEILIINKSQLELEKEAAAAAAAGSNEGSPQCSRPVTPAKGEDASAVAMANKMRAEREASASSHARRFAPAQKKPLAPQSPNGQGLAGMLKKHVCALDRDKLAAKAAGPLSPTARVQPGRAKLAEQQGEEWGNMGLLELQKPHKSRLTREKEAWAAAHGEVYKSPVRKIEHKGRKVHTPGASPGAPSFMRDTCSSTQKHIDVQPPMAAPLTP